MELSRIFENTPIYICKKIKMGSDEFGDRIAVARFVYEAVGQNARRDFIGKDINTSKVLVSGITESGLGYDFIRTRNSVYCVPFR